MEYILVIIICYTLGMINPSLLLGLFKGVNIRKEGSRNPGTSNAAMTFGLRYGIFVGLIDILKSALPVMILRVILFPEDDILWILGGFFVIIGHIFPAFMKFKGGKGTAAFGGLLIGAMPLYALVMAILYFGMLYFWDYIALSTLMVVTVTPVYMFFNGFSLISVLLMIVVMIISIYLHMPNFARIYHGYEVGIKKAFKK